MLPLILAIPQIEERIAKAEEIIQAQGFSKNHPDILWIEDTKLGVEQAKQIRNHLSLKPFQHTSKAVVILYGEKLTTDAQNALLKTLEEPLGEAMILIGVDSEEDLLPTILSRSQTITTKSIKKDTNPFLEKVPDLLKMDTEKRFQFIEKTEERQQLLEAIIEYYHHQLHIQSNQNKEYISSLRILLEAERWNSANVTPRAILEYLMIELQNT